MTKIWAFYPFLGEGSPAQIDYKEKAPLILTSLLEDLGCLIEPLAPMTSRWTSMLSSQARRGHTLGRASVAVLQQLLPAAAAR